MAVRWRYVISASMDNDERSSGWRRNRCFTFLQEAEKGVALLKETVIKVRILDGMKRAGFFNCKMRRN